MGQSVGSCLLVPPACKDTGDLRKYMQLSCICQEDAVDKKIPTIEGWDSLKLI